MPINKNELTKEQIQKAMSCETAEELMALAKTEGMELTKEEAEAYMAEFDDMELDSESLKNVAGGYCHRTKEQIAKAMACETVEELMALAKAEGVELTKEEAEAYMAEMEDVELDSEALTRVAGGESCYMVGGNECHNRGHGPGL